MAEQFDGVVSIAATAGGDPVITLSGATGGITSGAAGRDGDLVLKDASGVTRVLVNGQNGTIQLKDGNGRDSVLLDSRFGLLDLGALGNEGDLRIRDNAGRFVFTFDATFAVLDLGAQGNEGDLRVRDDNGDVTIHLDGNAGDIKLLGADLAEEFAVRGEADAPAVPPGAVVVAVGPDEVEQARRPADTRVVGVASGAGDLRPGLRLGVRGGTGRLPVAVAGRAWALADAGHGRIDVGDLLTTSATPGHAMRVPSPGAAPGAVLGKALGGLVSGTGMVPVLLALG